MDSYELFHAMMIVGKYPQKEIKQILFKLSIRLNTLHTGYKAASMYGCFPGNQTPLKRQNCVHYELI